MVSEPAASELTAEGVWQRRRRLVLAAGLGAAGLAVPRRSAPHDVAEPLTPWELATRHNNYYEFSPAKDVVWKLAEAFTPTPWAVSIDGEVERPHTWDLDDLHKRFAQEDRIYRLRCVEGWSMVVPWRGFPLGALLAEARPLSRARFVEFHSLQRPAELIQQRRPVLPWPYLEALRIDEAMHPLALMVTGLYGKPLPNQNGAPLRLAVPWKYGFKSPKAIVRIRLVETASATTWMRAAPSEYGFYGNVNPEVAHPRWPQRRELRLGETAKRATLPFNGYATEVAHLYAGMDLSRHF